ncbi:MAG: glucosaminidase domain-containing protein [Ktedonobacteraceae bacterium]
MASGNYARQLPRPTEPLKQNIPARATRALPALRDADTNETGALAAPIRTTRVVAEFAEHPLTRHVPWLRLFLAPMIVVIVGAIVLISASYMQRPGPSNLAFSPNAKVFSIQVGGTIGNVTTWTNSKGPLPIKKPITQKGPYSVLGKPSLSVAFMNNVLAYYHSPAAGLAQYLYNDGVQYGIDPAYALAFFMHESLFGTTGVARVTKSLGNMRCVPQFACLQTSDGGYAIFSSWQQSFVEWFKLIRNLYIVQLGEVTIDQIIPTYAPSSDHNNEAEYIATLKYELNSWHAGIVAV